MKWTEELDATIIRMAGDGASSSEIANAIGVSRNSVIGRAGRKGVKLLFGKTPNPHHIRMKIVSPPRWKPLVFSRPIEETGEPVSLMDLAYHHCRYPLGGQMFCGTEREEPSSYCQAHTKLCHTPRREK